MESMSEGPANTAATAGAWLRNARQQRGLHIAALAVMLKVPQSKLEALEADRYDQLPDATFARALATAVCRALKVDSAPVLALLPRTGDRELDVRPGLNQPFRERGAGGPSDGGVLTLAMRPFVWAPIVVLLVAAAIYWVPAGWLPERDHAAATGPAFPASSVAAASAPVEFVQAPIASEPAASTPTQVVTAAPVPVNPPVASAPLQVRDVAPPPAVAAAPAPTTASAPVRATVTATSGNALRVTATADTWVEVSDAQGQVLLSRVLRQGEQQDYSGASPYKVRIGNVSGTKIEWRGAEVDLVSRSKDNIARIELN
jgi:cytoskeleton protein RodZ